MINVEKMLDEIQLRTYEETGYFIKKETIKKVLTVVDINLMSLMISGRDFIGTQSINFLKRTRKKWPRKRFNT